MLLTINRLADRPKNSKRAQIILVWEPSPPNQRMKAASRVMIRKDDPVNIRAIKFELTRC
jgi:hypothetical protein